jgi:protein arginine kinase
MSTNSSVKDMRVCEECAVSGHWMPDGRATGSVVPRSIKHQASSIKQCPRCHSRWTLELDEEARERRTDINVCRTGSGARRGDPRVRGGYQVSRLGCPACYTEFREELTPLLRRIHGSIVHRGKAPAAKGTTGQVDRGTRGNLRVPLSRDLPAYAGISRISPTAEAEWMQGTGPDSDVVISTRVRLARNISGYAFPNHLAARCTDLAGKKGAARRTLEKIVATVEDAAVGAIASSKHGQTQGSPIQRASIIKLEHLSAVDREFLIERHLISRDLADAGGQTLMSVARDDRTPGVGREVIVGEKEAVSIMLNEEDHIRLQIISSGLQLRQSWETINVIDDELGRGLSPHEYAFSRDWGYLTACPSNVGTGLRVSVMLHIPALAATECPRVRGDQSKGQRAGRDACAPGCMPTILSSISDMGYAVRGMYGEGSRATGAFYQISNEATLGQSEEEIVDRVRSVARQIIDRERDARHSILEGKATAIASLNELAGCSTRRDPRVSGGHPVSRIEIEDIIFRSYGTLANARLISSRESLDLLSWVSLGVNTGILSESVIGMSRRDARAAIARLLVLIRPAHLQKYSGRKLDTAARDMNRAAVIRKGIGVSQ